MALMTERDWYAYLQLPPQASTSDVEQAVERLSRQASALAATAPERSQQLRETIRAIKRDLLSGPEGPRSYDAPRVRDVAPPSPPTATAMAPPPAPAPRRAPKHAKPEPAPVPPAPAHTPMPPTPAPAAHTPMPPTPAPAPAAHTPMPPTPAPVQAMPAPTPPGPALVRAPMPAGPVPAPMPSVPVETAPPGQGAGSRLARFLRTGWTCPACGKGAVPSDKFCTGCGTPIRLIRPEAASEPDRVPSPRPFCPSCANPLGTMDVFCSKCGARR